MSSNNNYATASSDKKTSNRYISRTYKTSKEDKFCKICKDTGKTREEYTNHYVRETRDHNSPIVCPTLLATVCRYCKGTGHTVSKCEKLNTRKRTDANPHIVSKIYCEPVNENENKNKNKNKNTNTNTNTNSFGCFTELVDSDDESEVENENENETMVKDVVMTETPINQKTINYANAVIAAPIRTQGCKSASQVSSLIPTNIDFSAEDDNDTKNISDRNIPATTICDLSGNWADCEDDDAYDVSTHVTIKRPQPDNSDSNDRFFNHYAERMDIIVGKYTAEFTKFDTLTDGAFMYLANKWDKESFCDLPPTMEKMANMTPASRQSSRMLFILNRYTK